MNNATLATKPQAKKHLKRRPHSLSDVAQKLKAKCHHKKPEEFTDVHFNDLFRACPAVHCFTMQDSPRMMDSLALTLISPSEFSATHS